MTHIELLGVGLKSDFFNDLLETFDVDVVYRYDRTYENLPDEYWATVPNLGLGLIFDENQNLATLIIQPVSISGYNPIQQDQRLVWFASKAEVSQYAVEQSMVFSEGAVELFGELKDWIKLEYSDFSIHYEYVDSKLKQVTLQATSA